MDGYIGTITCFAGDFIPKNWMACNGQQIRITAYPALYSILSNVFGGDGQTYFNLPDLRGRTPAGVSSSPPNSIALGQMAGVETATLAINQLPPHTHDASKSMAGLQANSGDGIDPSPNGGYPSKWTGAYATASNCIMLGVQTNITVGNTGAAQPQPIPTLSPYLAINYIICISGIYPGRG